MVWTNPCVDILGSISATKKRSFCVADWENRRTPATGTTSRSSSVEEKCQWVPIRWKGHRRRRARRMSSLAEDWGAAFLLLRGFTVYRFPSQKKKEHDIRVPDICQGIEILDGFHSPPQILEPFGAKVCARPRLQSQYDCDLPAWWVPERMWRASLHLIAPFNRFSSWEITPSSSMMQMSEELSELLRKDKYTYISIHKSEGSFSFCLWTYQHFDGD